MINLLANTIFFLATPEGFIIALMLLVYIEYTVAKSVAKDVAFLTQKITTDYIKIAHIFSVRTRAVNANPSAPQLLETKKIHAN